MRGDLRAQIEVLERRLTALAVSAFPLESAVVSPSRGPAVLDTADLECVRDELVAALEALQRRVAERAVAQLPATPGPRDGASRRHRTPRVAEWAARLLRRPGHSRDGRPPR